MPRKRTSEDAFFDRMASRFAEEFVRWGIVVPHGKTDAELYKEIRKAADEHIRGDDLFVTEHRGEILKHARSFKLEKKDELAVLFYALWMEHQINFIIIALAQRKDVPTTEMESLIRETSYRAKCSWLLRILSVTRISESHTNMICKLMERRNGFVHYNGNQRMNK